MIVPGSNLLAMALGVIGQQSVQWSRYIGMTTTTAGVERPTWADPVTISGSLQPVDTSLLQQLGLDWTRNYVTFFAPAEFREIERDQSSDRITYGGRTYQVVSKTAWWQQDGWEKVICVEVPPNA
jgi:hypothetical protein